MSVEYVSPEALGDRKKIATYRREDDGLILFLCERLHGEIDGMYDRMRAPTPRQQADLDQVRAGKHAEVATIEATCRPDSRAATLSEAKKSRAMMLR